MNDITIEKILQIIKKVRLESKISQADISKKIGMSKSFYGMLERGHRSLSVEYLLKIADVLDMNATDLFILAEHNSN